MRIAVAAQHFGALHEMAAIRFRPDVLPFGWSPEARPSRSGIEFLVGAEQFSATADAAVDAGLVVVPIPPCERPLRPLLACNGVFLRRKLLPPFGILFFDL